MLLVSMRGGSTGVLSSSSWGRLVGQVLPMVCAVVQLMERLTGCGMLNKLSCIWIAVSRGVSQPHPAGTLAGAVTVDFIGHLVDQYYQYFTATAAANNG